MLNKEAQKVLDAMRSFAAEHPELAKDAADAIEAGVADVAPEVREFGFYDIIRRIVDHGLFGGDRDMAAKAHAAIDAHQDEHDQATRVADAHDERDDQAHDAPETEH